MAVLVLIFIYYKCGHKVIQGICWCINLFWFLVLTLAAIACFIAYGAYQQQLQQAKLFLSVG